LPTHYVSVVFSQTPVYPELTALYGSHLPDTQGLFLRGYGAQYHTQWNGETIGYTPTFHQSGPLGQVQGDATRNINAPLGNAPIRTLGSYFGGAGAAWEVDGAYAFASGVPITTEGNGIYGLNISRVVPTAPENRPVNMAVRYLVYARK
jgi:hypothetical protein